MTFLSKWQWRLGAVTAVLGCAALGVWQAGANPITNRTGTQTGSMVDKQKLHERMRRGVGSEVRFSTAKDSDGDIGLSIESVAQFIHRRSNMTMSDETKSDLHNAEMETLRGKRPPISIEALTDSLTSSAAERIRTLSEKEIEGVANTFHPTSDGQITVRVAGNSAQVPRDVFLKEARTARELKSSGELESSIRPVIEFQIEDRAANLSEAMPEQFGRIKTEGVTPVQAVLIAYSVASDDSLADSQNDLVRQTVQDRMNTRLTRAEARANRLNSPTPYGRSGSSYASPANVLFNRMTVQSLLNSAEGGKGK